MVAYTNAIACQICGQIFPHAVPLLYHFDQVHGREGYTLAIQRNGSSVSRRTHFKLHSKQGHSQFPSRRNGHAILHTKFEQSYLNGMYARGQVYKDTEVDPVDFTEPFMKKLDKPFILDNVEEDGGKNLDLNLKL